VTPTPPPGSLAKVQRMDNSLTRYGDAIGRMVHHYLHGGGLHLSLSSHPAPRLALALILLALCGVILSVPAGVWMYKRRHHLCSSIRGLLSPLVWRERWKWHRCFRDTDTKKVRMDGHPPPKPIAGWPTRAGVTLVTRFDGGMTCEVAQKYSDEIGAAMRCRDIVFEPIYHNRGRGFCRIIRRDTLARTVAWPWAPSETTNFLGSIPVAVDMDGKPVTMDLRAKNVLVGGIPGSGKSWFLHLLIAAAMGDTRVQVYILDGKMGVELSVWEKSCAAFATDDEPKQAMEIVKRLEAEVNEAFADLRAEDKRTVDWSKATTVKVLVIDEYTAFLGIPGFEKALNELVRRGRAAGLIVILTTQRPSAQVIKTDLRGLIPLRVAMLCTDTTSSTMILGSGYHDFDSSKFSGKLPGEMWLLHEGRQPVHCRGYSLTDRDLASLAARAQALRVNSPQGTVKVAGQVVRDSPLRSRSSTPPSPTLVLLPPQPVPLSPQRRSVLQTIAELGPQVEGAAVRKALGMAPDRFSVHANALLTAGYATRAAKALQAAQFGHGRPAWCWTITQAGTTVLSRTDASRNERVAQPKEAGAQ
jgi:hypothetical protein